jgi:hypothetical protein
MTLISRRVAIAVASLGLLVSVLLISGLVDRAIESAVCVERAKYELILCVAPPDALIWILAAAVAVAFAVGLGIAIGTPTWLQLEKSNPTSDSSASASASLE